MFRRYSNTGDSVKFHTNRKEVSIINESTIQNTAHKNRKSKGVHQKEWSTREGSIYYRGRPRYRLYRTLDNTRIIGRDIDRNEGIAEFVRKTGFNIGAVRGVLRALEAEGYRFTERQLAVKYTLVLQVCTLSKYFYRD